MNYFIYWEDRSCPGEPNIDLEQYETLEEVDARKHELQGTVTKITIIEGQEIF